MSFVLRIDSFSLIWFTDGLSVDILGFFQYDFIQ